MTQGLILGVCKYLCRYVLLQPSTEVSEDEDVTEVCEDGRER